MTRHLASFVGAALLLGSLCPATARAGAGDHIRTGDTTITPDIDLGLEYRTNVYRAFEDPTGGANLRIAPGLQIGVDTPQSGFELGGEWEIRKFLFLATDAADRADRIRSIDRFNDFDLGMKLDLLKDQSVGFKLSNEASLRNNQTDRGVLGNPFVTQVRNDLEAGLRITPGDALDIVPGGTWAYDDFRIADSDPFRTRFNSRNTYGPTLDADWRFFPRTAIVLHGEGLWYSWSEDVVSVVDPVSGASGPLAIPNSVHVKVLGGLEGRFTERVFIDLLAGYGTAMYEPSAGGAIDQAAADLTGLDGLLGSAQLRYKIVREADNSLESSVGFKRDFTDSFFSNYVAYNEAFASLTARLNALKPRAKYSIRFEDYSGAVVRNDILNRFDTGLGYQFRDWGSVDAGMAWQQRSVLQSAFDTVEYDDFTVSLKSTFCY